MNQKEADKIMEQLAASAGPVNNGRGPSAAIAPESVETPLVGTGSWIGDLLRKEADEWDKIAAVFDEPTPTDRGTEWRRMAAYADEMHAALAQAKTLLCEKYEFEAAAKLSELLKASSPINGDQQRAD